MSASGSDHHDPGMVTPAEVQITNLIHRYAHHIDQAEFGRAAALFDRAVVVMGGEELDAAGAHQRYRDTVLLHGGLPRTHHLMHNIIIDFSDDGSTAQVETKYTVFQRIDGQLQPIITGGYHDQFGSEGGEWFFTRREYWMGLVGDVSRHIRRPDPGAVSVST